MASPGAPALVVALVGAESTGKSTLAQALAAHLAGPRGLRATWVPEHLRSWCDAAGRPPHRHEQAAIAEQQTRLIAAAAATHDVVVADTTALMTAVYHHTVFADDGLDVAAAQAHRRCQLTLLTALDLPWVADGLQREGPHVQGPVDARLRLLMARHGIGWQLVHGQGHTRLASALQAVLPLLPAR